MAKIKYIRVSTKHQNTARQEQNREQFDKVFIDKESGKNTDREQFKKMMDYVREGDEVYFESFSRISRSLTDLLNILDTFDKKGVTWVSEKEQISTSGATGRLVVAVLGAIAEYEREINAERREFGYRKALSENKVGRPKVEVTEDYKKVYEAWKVGEITAEKAAKKANLAKATFYKLAKEIEGRQ